MCRINHDTFDFSLEKRSDQRVALIELHLG
jgi:hypothetical protein